MVRPQTNAAVIVGIGLGWEQGTEVQVCANCLHKGARARRFRESCLDRVILWLAIRSSHSRYLSSSSRPFQGPTDLAIRHAGARGRGEGEGERVGLRVAQGTGLDIVIVSFETVYNFNLCMDTL